LTQSDTIPKVLLEQYHKYGGRKVAMRKKDYGIWNEYTWKDVYKHVKYISLGLKSLGLERKDKVCILGDNDPEWFFAQLGTQCMGGISVGIFVDCNASEVKYYIEHSNAKFIFARDQEQVDKVLKIKDKLSGLIKIIYWDPRGLWSYKEPELLSIEELEGIGKQCDQESPDFLEKSILMGNASDIAIICYTSGTTALPKGVVLSYRNLQALYDQISHVEKFYKTDSYLSYISPAWLAEQIFVTCCGMHIPFVIHFPEKPETVQDDLRNVGPQLIFYGARFWENLASAIQVKIIDTTPFKRLCYRLALKMGYKKVSAIERNERLGMIWRVLTFLSDLFVARPLRDRVGLSRARSCFTAGAAISPDTMKLFHAIGVNLKNIYGSTECGVITWHRDGDVRAGTLGPPVPGVELRISKDGEIQCKSEGIFEEYYKDPEATSDRIRDGFYCTGDAGYLDEKNHLIYYDRMEDMVDLLGADTKFSPQYIESRLRFSVYIKDAIVIGGKDNPFVIALIVMDFDNMAKWAESRKIVFGTYADLSQKTQTCELIRKEILKVNQFLSELARIKKFVVLPKELDPDEAEITRTRKLKRRLIEDKYSGVIKCIYGGEEKLRLELEVKYQDGKVGKISMDLAINYT
jgi:long-chain acyl-CoA synthetase